MKYEVKWTSHFKKDFKLARKRNLDLELLYKVIALLANGVAPPPMYHDHIITGEYHNAHECHIKPDWLLVYNVYENILVLELMRTGTHSDLF